MIFQTYLESWDADYLNTLNNMPITKDTVVTIAFGDFNPDMPIGQDTISGLSFNKEQIDLIIATVKAKGGKTIMSFGGATYELTTSPFYPDCTKIGDKIVKIIDKYGFDGCDIDVEEQQNHFSFSDKVLDIIKEVRAKKPETFISVTIPGQAWNKYWRYLAIDAQNFVDTINFMEYDIWVASDYVYQITSDILDHYVQEWGIPVNKISLGLMPGYDDGKRELTLEMAKILATWSREQKLNGIMIWDANRDYKGINGSPSFAFTNSILENI